MTRESQKPVPESESPISADKAQTEIPARGNSQESENNTEAEREVMSPADLLAEVAAEIFPAESGPEEQTGAGDDLAETLPESEAQPGHAAEPPFSPQSIEETVLRPETETAAIAAEPDLDVALEEASKVESEQAETQSSPQPQALSKATEAPAPLPGTAAATQARVSTPQQEPHQAIKREDGPENSPFNIFVSQVYEGPMDLLLDLIRKQDIDIYDIPISKITAQFLAYVNHLRASDMDVAGEFIYTASLLIHIKSKMLLPREPSGPDDAQDDPRRELVERLLEHERFKNAAQMLQQKQMLEAATWSNPGVRDFVDDTGAEPEIAADTVDLVRIFRDILDRARNRPILNVEEDTVTVGQMIQFLARRLTMEDKPIALRRLLSQTKSERALIAMFLALLELVRLQAILLRQDLHFSEIFIKKNSGFEAVLDQGQIQDDWQ